MDNLTQLNIGSGEFKKPGFINVDSLSHLQPDIVHDLETFPYPFTDNSMTAIEADHVLEHLRSPFKVMKELHRILQPSGKLTIRVPHFSRGFTHADHKCAFDVTFPCYFNRTFKGGYMGVEFTLVAMRLTWFAQPYLKKTVLSPFAFYGAVGLGSIFDTLANVAPYVCSRIWCFWVGGFEQIEFQFICKK